MTTLPPLSSNDQAAVHRIAALLGRHWPERFLLDPAVVGTHSAAYSHDAGAPYLETVRTTYVKSVAVQRRGRSGTRTNVPASPGEPGAFAEDAWVRFGSPSDGLWPAAEPTDAEFEAFVNNLDLALTEVFRAVEAAAGRDTHAVARFAADVEVELTGNIARRNPAAALLIRDEAQNLPQISADEIRAHGELLRDTLRELRDAARSQDRGALAALYAELTEAADAWAALEADPGVGRGYERMLEPGRLGREPAERGRSGAGRLGGLGGSHAYTVDPSEVLGIDAARRRAASPVVQRMLAGLGSGDGTAVRARETSAPTSDGIIRS